MGMSFLCANVGGKDHRATCGQRNRQVSGLGPSVGQSESDLIMVNTDIPGDQLWCVLAGRVVAGKYFAIPVGAVGSV